MKERKCRVCGCTDDDCRGCIERTGEPCHWVEWDLCSACVGGTRVVAIATGDDVPPPDDLLDLFESIDPEDEWP